LSPLNRGTRAAARKGVTYVTEKKKKKKKTQTKKEKKKKKKTKKKKTIPNVVCARFVVFRYCWKRGA